MFMNRNRVGPGVLDRCARPHERARARGVTLVELVVTMAVMAILVGLAAPSFTRLMASDRLSTQTNELVMSLNTAKSEAVKRGLSTTLRSGDQTDLINFHRGWQVFTDSDGDGVPASPATEADGTVLRDTATLAGTTTVVRSTRAGANAPFTYPAATGSVPGRGHVTFNGRGGLNTGGSVFFRICDSANPGIPGRIVQVNTVGRISLDSTTENCTL
jgi:type IV fimbrial biogenesis protein FimT